MKVVLMVKFDGTLISLSVMLSTLSTLFCLFISTGSVIIRLGIFRIVVLGVKTDIMQWLTELEPPHISTLPKA